MALEKKLGIFAKNLEEQLQAQEETSQLLEEAVALKDEVHSLSFPLSIFNPCLTLIVLCDSHSWHGKTLFLPTTSRKAPK